MHHYSANNNFFADANRCNCIESDTKYSIVSIFNYESILQSYNHITLLLEYRQINSYQIWKQNSSLLSNYPNGYQKVRGDNWDEFQGLARSDVKNCLDYTGTEYGWWYSIGASDRGYGTHVPGPIIDGVQYLVYYVDLWIKVHNPALSCPQLCSYIMNLNIYLTQLLS
ncbi:hypothetical protein TVAG_198580 [Trichomonas vaginalis G3]|uniref:Uncharacterized protein n=1 Tax=Trichomonas vaginalis (strain ATCC PRA-98 / G3) TaxID=412133 RepID=A2DDP3_TRIV3|nr:hypothetical protein TVAGG3_0999000 [Trichomonas vaginalis G3]EAY21419.1 hypothetical protein TVAG_198580 [Trichomonas vaginalis G3]KAI5490631.1 hypothetical protein TVAGG3_0999000 [Trichomonas vaginalis G3]|eukprot:XP_001582405.1 hypothetical protein [Trichomonas vaginalis G3]